MIDFEFEFDFFFFFSSLVWRISQLGGDGTSFGQLNSLVEEGKDVAGNKVVVNDTDQEVRANDRIQQLSRWSSLSINAGPDRFPQRKCLILNNNNQEVRSYSKKKREGERKKKRDLPNNERSRIDDSGLENFRVREHTPRDCSGVVGSVGVFGSRHIQSIIRDGREVLGGLNQRLQVFWRDKKLDVGLIVVETE